MGAAKLAILFFYLRISPDRRFRISVYVTMGIVVAATIALTLPQLFACRSLSDTWTPTFSRLLFRKCIDLPKFSLAVAGVNFATDILVIALPIPMLRGLNMPLRQKIAVGLWFAIGSLSVLSRPDVTVLHRCADSILVPVLSASSA
jgi:hypothetical protein